MMEKQAFFLLPSLFVIFVTFTSTNGAVPITTYSTYKAMVVEYNPYKLDSPQATMLKNLNEYKSYIQKAEANNAQIVVFPEYGLSGIVSDPRDYAVELTNRSYSEDKVVIELTHITKEAGIYVVVNLYEKELNTKDKKTYYYNTNVVLDKKGDILTKYRKINLDSDEEKYVTAGTETVVFETDFSITFGLITGRDILYNKPSREVFDLGATDVIYPSAMVSVTPVFHSLSLQHGYAQVNGINLLAANLDEPNSGLGGSGLYNADGTIGELYIDSSTSTKPIARTLSRNNVRQNTECTLKPSSFGLRGSSAFGLNVNNISNFITETNFPTSKGKFKNIEFKSNTGETVGERVCDGKIFCCNFNITTESVNLNEVYKVMAFDGTVRVHNKDLHIRTCALVACLSKDDSTCGSRVNATTVFKRIEVTADLPNSDFQFYQPLSLNYDLQPFDKTTFCLDTNVNNDTSANAYAKYLMNAQSSDGLVIFGILGRVNGASSLVFSLGALLMSMMVAFRVFV